MSLKLSSIEERALALLGEGVQAEQVSAALGVTPSYISQLLSDEAFANAVSERKFVALQKHNARDAALDSLEDKILDKIEQTLPMVMRPMELVRMLQVINGAKRRGASSAEHVTAKQTVVPIVMPVTAITAFTVNAQNHVVKVGDQTLVPLQSGTLLKQVKQNDSTKAAIPGPSPGAETEAIGVGEQK